MRQRLCDGHDWMVIERQMEELEEDEEDENNGEKLDKDEIKGEKSDEDESFSLFDPDLCHRQPDAAYLDKTLARVSR